MRLKGQCSVVVLFVPPKHQSKIQSLKPACCLGCGVVTCMVVVAVLFVPCFVVAVIVYVVVCVGHVCIALLNSLDPGLVGEFMLPKLDATLSAFFTVQYM